MPPWHPSLPPLPLHEHGVQHVHVQQPLTPRPAPLVLQQQARLLLQVHDELLFEVSATAAAEFGAWVKKVMEEAVALKVPVVVDVKAGPNWQEMKRI